MQMGILSTIILLCAVVGSVWTFHVPQALTVDCESLGNAKEFKHRQKWRQNAEDKTTIWLFKGEQLNIHIELDNDAILEVLDVRYSNDGFWDLIQLSLDEKPLGEFKTVPYYGWGNQWNNFESSGPIGGHHSLKAGKHSFALKVAEGDKYGVEIDYIRFNVHGSTFHRLDKNDFLCIHKPDSSGTKVPEEDKT